MTGDFISDFRTELSNAGLPYDGAIVADGKLHRFKAGEDKEPNSWYVLYPPDPVPAGAFGCWKRGFKNTVCPRNGDAERLSADDWKKIKSKFALADQQREIDEQERRKSARQRATILLEKAVPAMADHPYLTRKKVGVLGDIVASKTGELLLPLRDHEGTIQSIQSITADGDKRFLPGGRVQGCFYVINHRLDCPVVICEGYATGATIYEATGWCVVAAMNAGNLKFVAEVFRKSFPDKPIIIAADNDERLLNPDDKNRSRGVTKAREASEAVKGIVAIPQFPDDDQNGTDFNDLALLKGLTEVEKAFEQAFPTPLSVLTFDEINQIPTPESDRILGDHLLDRGSPLVIAGSGGTGKTRLVYQLIADIIKGQETWLGQLQIHLGSSSMNWLVLQTENSPRRLKQTRDCIKNHIGSDWDRFNRQVRVLTPLKDIDLMTNLDNLEVVHRLKTIINKYSPDAIVFDSLYDFSIGDISKDADMRASVIALSRLARHNNPKRAIIVLQHALTGQAGAARAVGFDRSSFARNSKSLFAWTRAQINIAPANEDNNDSIIIACGKCSDGQEFPPFAVTLNPDTMIYEHDPSISLDEWRETVSNKRGRPAATDPDSLLNLLPTDGLSNSDWLSQASNIHISKRSFYRLKKQLSDSKKIHFSVISDRWMPLSPHKQ